MASINLDRFTKHKIHPYAFAGMVYLNKKGVAKKTWRPNQVCKRIVEAVCNYFDISNDEIMDNCRKRYIVEARQIAMYLIQLKGIGCLDCAKYFRKDHTTALYSFSVVKNLIKTDANFRHRVSELRMLTETD
jgi:chromosomal replication initiation ATPase DnaA